MISYSKNNDLRVTKTHKFLLQALVELLEQRGLGRITVNDLCAEAQVSRPTFYAHFKDKYDLLDCWLESIYLNIKMLIDRKVSYCQIEDEVNNIIESYKAVTVNLFKNIDNETWERLNTFMLLIVDTFSQKSEEEKRSEEYVILSNFCAGGILNLMHRQYNSNLLDVFEVSSPMLYDMLYYLLGWSPKQGMSKNLLS